ncbi:MAG TPA: hypothetical protein VG013_10190 [Gemmataceae bacterium]|jgi:hypothetical protein|nr:hypothetical protein [Gemmataceae bacterium]
MAPHDPDDDWPVLGDNDPPLDTSRENAAYERERERLVRDHRGKIALIRKDEVVGVFATADEALLEGYRRFGLVKMVLRPIDDDGPDFISHVDIKHPSIKKLD